ncbi:MAG: TnpV protein [Lachnospiraceae bacterium]|nr:TnpV protein [Lachnospiraceae bacterium]
MIEDSPVNYGKYGMLRKNYLKENKRNWYQSMMLSGRLEQYLQEIDQRANGQMELTASQMAQAEGVTEQLKADDPMTWVARMNSIRNRAEEIVLAELIYS